MTGYGEVRGYRPGDGVILMAGALPGVIVRRVGDGLNGVPRYAVQTVNGPRYASVNQMKPDPASRPGIP
jgi:hypothetical protein